MSKKFDTFLDQEFDKAGEGYLTHPMVARIVSTLYPLLCVVLPWIPLYIATKEREEAYRRYLFLISLTEKLAKVHSTYSEMVAKADTPIYVALLSEEMLDKMNLEQGSFANVLSFKDKINNKKLEVIKND